MNLFFTKNIGVCLHFFFFKVATLITEICLAQHVNYSWSMYFNLFSELIFKTESLFFKMIIMKSKLGSDFKMIIRTGECVTISYVVDISSIREQISPT